MQISQSLPSGGNPGVDVDFDHTLLDGKFMVVSLEKLRIVHGDAIVAEKFLTETVRFPGTYHQFFENVDDEVFEAMDQLMCRLLCITHIIWHDAYRQIIGKSMKFSPEIHRGNNAIKSHDTMGKPDFWVGKEWRIWRGKLRAHDHGWTTSPTWWWIEEANVLCMQTTYHVSRAPKTSDDSEDSAGSSLTEK